MSDFETVPVGTMEELEALREERKLHLELLVEFEGAVNAMLTEGHQLNGGSTWIPSEDAIERANAVMGLAEPLELT